MDHADPPPRSRCILATSKMVSNPAKAALELEAMLQCSAVQCSSRCVQPYIYYRRGCGLELAMFVLLVLPILYPNGTLAGFAKATETGRAAK